MPIHMRTPSRLQSQGSSNALDGAAYLVLHTFELPLYKIDLFFDACLDQRMRLCRTPSSYKMQDRITLIESECANS